MSQMDRVPKSIIPVVTVGDYYSKNAETLHMKLVAGASGLKRKIREGSVNRPGLGLVGFFSNFAWKRIQVIGWAETSYLNSLTPKESRKRVRDLFAQKIPGIVFTRNIKPPDHLLEEAEAFNIPVFKSSMATLRYLNAATICMEIDFAPRTSVYGSMLDIQGIGVVIRGDSGIGKSECALSLLARGHSLVADDITRVRIFEGRELIGSASPVTRSHMEVRGLGIINAAHLFGIRSVRLEKRIDLVVTLEEWSKVEEVERVGLDESHYEILQIKIPHVIIPVRPGRDLATIVEIAAMDQKLKTMGQHSASEFNNRLIQTISNQ